MCYIRPYDIVDIVHIVTTLLIMSLFILSHVDAGKFIIDKIHSYHRKNVLIDLISPSVSTITCYLNYLKTIIVGGYYLNLINRIVILKCEMIWFYLALAVDC